MLFKLWSFKEHSVDMITSNSLTIFSRKGNPVSCLWESNSFWSRWVLLGGFVTPSSTVGLGANFTWSSMVSHSTILVFFPRNRNWCNKGKKKKVGGNSRCTSPLPGSHWMLVFHFQFSPYTGWLFKIKITMLAILNC